MGINTLAYMPSTTNLGDIALAIQKLTDADEVTLDVNSWDKERPIASATRGQDCVFASIIDVVITREDGFGDLRDGSPVTRHDASLHLSSAQDGKVYTLLYCGTASAFWAALSDGLVGFFGGIVDYNDCDENEADTVVRATRYAKVTNGDAAWVKKQTAINNLTVVTDELGLSQYDTTPGIYNRKSQYVTAEVA